MDNLITPYGSDRLANPMAGAERADALRREALALPSIDLLHNQLPDLELLLNGGYSPLDRYMGRADYDSVLRDLQLADGTLWPLPIVLDVAEQVAATLAPGNQIALRDPEGFMLAVLTIEDVWQPDKTREAEALFGTANPAHPGVAKLLQSGSHYVSGRLEGLALPLRYDFTALRLTPEELRKSFVRRGWRRIIAYQARQPLHRAQFEFTLRAALGHEANLLLHPLAGSDPADDTEHFTRVSTYQAVLPRYPSATTALALLPLLPREADGRDILLRAIVQRNYGCSHLIVGGEYEERGTVRRGTDISSHEDLRQLAVPMKAIGVELIAFPRMVYVEERDQHMPEGEVPPGLRTLTLSGEELRRRLAEGRKIPEWYSYPEVIAELRKTHPPRDKQGFTVFFTGLSGSGKSTLAKVLMIKLLEMGGRRVTLLDGDLVRKHLSRELGFSKEHRDINIRRIGYVASEITKNNGIAICAPIAPYRSTRRAVRAMIEPLGGFIEVHVATSLEVCEGRDRKGLYAKARAGIVKEFTGISDPYELPEAAELVLDTGNLSVDEAVQRILLKLEQEGYLR
jgi:sulfate adenylyltransferase